MFQTPPTPPTRKPSMATIRTWAVTLLTITKLVRGYHLDLSSTDSIRAVASDMVDDMMSFYHGNEPGQTPGLLPPPYFWWEGGALMGALIDYWYYTGDARYNEIAQEGLLWQAGLNEDYMPLNQTRTEGNDDQGFWAMAALSAAEYRFPNPPPDQPQWLALAQAAFNTQASRWDTSSCNGGLRWQIFTWNKGFDYKNSISQACFFNIAARLALYTGNATYADWTYKVWDWMIESKFMHQETYFIYDGAHIGENCGNLTPYQWTYNPGAFLLGAAAMYNYTAENEPASGQLWKTRIDGLLSGIDVFFIGDDKVMSEVACESVHFCDNDQLSFKAYLARWMAAATKWAPWTYNTIKSLMDSSAKAAAQQCSGGENGRMCGLMWANNSGQWDGTSGVGQQMAAMEVVLGTMIKNLSAPVTDSSGGTSVGNPGGGTKDMYRSEPSPVLRQPIKPVDRAWAWILTLMLVACLLTCIFVAFTDEKDERTWRQTWTDCRSEQGFIGGLKFSVGRQVLQKPKKTAGGRGKAQRVSDLDGPPTPPPPNVVPKGVSMASVSVYSSDQIVGPSKAVVRVDNYPNEQPWRRPAREGDFAGAEDPNRGNGAGFGIIDAPTAREFAPPSSSASEPGPSASTEHPRDSWTVASQARELNARMAMTTKLQKKPLPSKPGLGRRHPGQTMGSEKV